MRLYELQIRNKKGEVIRTYETSDLALDTKILQETNRGYSVIVTKIPMK